MSGLFSQYSMRSLPEMSVLFPIEANIATPRPRSEASARIASPRAPDWDTNPTFPRAGAVAAKVAFRRTCGSVLITPMQFGPTIRIPYRRSFTLISASRPAPSAPTSLNPAVITTSPRTPFRPHSSTTSRTRSRGTVITARSTGPGISPIEA